MKQRKTIEYIIIAGLVTVLTGLCLFVPGFGAAIWQTLYCAFANVTCVQVMP